MLQRGTGTILNVAGMIAFSGPADKSVMPRRAVYAGTLAYLVAMTQTLAAEVEGTGVKVAVVCPGVVATEFHSSPRSSQPATRHDALFRQPCGSM